MLQWSRFLLENIHLSRRGALLCRESPGGAPCSEQGAVDIGSYDNLNASHNGLRWGQINFRNFAQSYPTSAQQLRHIGTSIIHSGRAQGCQ